MRLLSTAALTLFCFLPACVVVVDNDHDEDWDSSYVQHDTPRIGVELTKPSAATASQIGVDRSRCCMIDSVQSDSPAARAGLQKYDVVTAVDGHDYATISALREAIRSRKPGETLNITIVRAGQRQEIPVTIGEY